MRSASRHLPDGAFKAAVALRTTKELGSDSLAGGDVVHSPVGGRIVVSSTRLNHRTRPLPRTNCSTSSSLQRSARVPPGDLFPVEVPKNQVLASSRSSK
jgi:hypothetical protein